MQKLNLIYAGENVKWDSHLEKKYDGFLKD
jgi:hypothetical protein